MTRALHLVPLLAILVPTVQAAQIDRRMTPPRVQATAVALLPDGAPLVGRSDGQIVSIDLETGATVACFAAHPASVTTLAIDPRGEFVAAASVDGRIAIWPITKNAGTRREGYPGLFTDPAVILRPTPEVWNAPVEVEWTHDGEHLLTWAFDRLHGASPTTVQLWSRAGELLWTGPHARQVSVHPSRDCIAVVIEDEVLFGWPGEDLRTIELKGAYDAVDFSSDGAHFAVGGRGMHVWILDGETGETLLDRPRIDYEGMVMHDHIVRLRWSPDGHWIGAVVGKGLQPAILEASTLQTVWGGGMYGARMWQIFDVIWTPGGRLLTGFNSVFAADPRTGETQVILKGVEHQDLIDLDGSSDVLLLASGALRRIDLTTATEIWKRREQGAGSALVEAAASPAAKERR